MASSAMREVLMLEAPPAEAAGVPWHAPPDAEAVDALPYIDGDYGDPAVKREVDRLVEEEMRRAHRKPADFLRDLPTVLVAGFEIRRGLRLYDADASMLRLEAESEAALLDCCFKDESVAFTGGSDGSVVSCPCLSILTNASICKHKKLLELWQKHNSSYLIHRKEGTFLIKSLLQKKS